MRLFSSKHLLAERWCVLIPFAYNLSVKYTLAVGEHCETLLLPAGRKNAIKDET